MNKIITIGREYASGGSLIAKKLSEKLDIPCYDKAIIGKTAVETGLVESDVKKYGEYLSTTRKIVSHFTLYNLYSNMTKDDKIFFAQEKIIKQLADEGPCIIVGRCADYILRERDNVIKVFIYSDFDNRIKRATELKMDDNPETFIKEKDEQREEYYNLFTDMKWGEPHHYDICLNSGALGFDKCVEILSDLY